MKYIEVSEHHGEGYLPMIRYEGWRVALLNYSQRVDEVNLHELERHRLTDEVFVLLCGSATLIIGGDGDKPEKIQRIPMESGKLYNVKKDVWHHIITSRDVSVLIVENDNTGRENSQYAPLDAADMGGSKT